MSFKPYKEKLIRKKLEFGSAPDPDLEPDPDDKDPKH